MLQSAHKPSVRNMESNVTYIWQRDDWPNFVWDNETVDSSAHAYALEASRLVGEVAHLSDAVRTGVQIDLIVSEAVKTSQIEGESYDRQDVRSSIRNQLGLNAVPAAVRDPRANGVAALMISVREHFAAALTEERLCKWQELIIADGFGRGRIEVGKWRSSESPMQVVSRAFGKEKVHYEAPPSKWVPGEMKRFVEWFNGSRNLKGAVRAGVAHLYFECIHPFDDGNGRVGRAISETALSQELGYPALLSLSATIQDRVQEYYDALERAGRGSVDITEWLVWFTHLALESQMQAREHVIYVIAKARFWDAHGVGLNERQAKVLARMFLEGRDGFKGGMHAGKYMKMAGCSKATATRDLARLLQMGAFRKQESGGRSTRYDVRLPDV